jgi:hypothetical protein
MSLFKASAHARELKQRLKLLLPNATISESLDTNSMPILKISVNAENQFIKIETDDNAGRVDGLGLSQRVYSPHVASIVQESDAPAGAEESEARIKCISSIGKLGMKVSVWTGSGAGAETSYDDAKTASSLVTTLPSDEINPLTMSQ